MNITDLSSALDEFIGKSIVIQTPTGSKHLDGTIRGVLSSYTELADSVRVEFVESESVGEVDLVAYINAKDVVFVAYLEETSGETKE